MKRGVLVLLTVAALPFEAWGEGPGGGKAAPARSAPKVADDEPEEVSPEGAGAEGAAAPHGSGPATTGAATGAAGTAAEKSGSGETSLLRIVGKLHPTVVHLPIGWLLLLLVVDLGAILFGRVTWTRAGFLILVSVVLSYLPAAATGMLRASQLPADEDLALVSVHRNLMLLSFGCCVAALGLRWARRNQLAGVLRAVYVALLLGAAALMTVGGHRGAELVRGPDYLPF